MVQALNFIGLNVFLDFVYNHLHANGPHDKDSVLDKVDGFRFDLMGHIMKDTMVKAKSAIGNLRKETDEVDGSRIYIYGEGWNFGKVANNGRGVNASQFNLTGTGIGSFNDRIRDATLGGSIWSSSSTRIRYRFIVTYNKIAYTFFYTNNKHHITCYIAHVSVSNLGVEPLKFPYHQNIVYPFFPNGHDHEATQQLMLSTAKDHIQIGMAANLKDYVLTNHEGKDVKGSEILMHDATSFAYASQPTETLMTMKPFFDIISLKTPMEISVAERCRINHLASSMIALSQGIPFFHAGDKILRSKSLDRDSYNSGDWFNRLDFSYKSNNWGVGLPPKGKNEHSWPLIKPRLQDPSFKPQSSHIVATLNSFLDLLRIRYSSPLFRLDSAKEIQDRVLFHNTGPSSVPDTIVMSIEDGHKGIPSVSQIDPVYSFVVVIFNARPSEFSFLSPSLKNRNLELHPVQVKSGDEIVKKSVYDAFSGVFTVPARTTTVFVEVTLYAIERFRDVAGEIRLEMADDLVHVSDLTKRPEVEMGMEETVRSVRLTRRARQSPKRLLRRRLKEETAEKEWSDSGRRGGVESEGKMRKERETRDGERALSVVEEMKRSEEKFVMEIEVTRRNWVLWGEEVGVVEEVRGTEEMVGEGVGEREGAVRIVAGKRRGRRSNGGRRGES
uniref:Alpha-1,6-glucosidases pullulanase-type C-terminal domain-containing protein n=1 Tax=Brassica campestris TaxID=3711 RepID=A0A3P5ZBJ1_BRACM|nr:unnamed protein product [Brassica rapa]